MVGGFYVHTPTNASTEDAERKMLKTDTMGARQRINAGPSIHVSLSESVKSIQVKGSCDVVHEVSMKQSVSHFVIPSFLLMTSLSFEPSRESHD